MERWLILISVLSIIIFWSVSCSKKDYKDMENVYLFDKDEEIILGGGVNDTTILVDGKLNANYYWVSVYDDVTADSTVTYHPDEREEVQEVQGDWFTISAKENKVNICTSENMEDHERQVRLVFSRRGYVVLIVKQKKY